MARWLLVVLALAVAGCGSPDKPIAGIPLGEEGEALPNLAGFVVDEAIRPMAGVTVRILLTNVTTVTDEDGHYAIWRPTYLAETVLLSAAAPGYVPRTQQVQVSGHVSTRMDFRLEPDPYQVAHVEVLDQRGSLGCQVHAALPGAPAPLAYACDPPNASLDGIEFPKTYAAWDIGTNVGLAGAVVQLHWDAETALTQTLHATLFAPVVGCCELGDDTGSKGEVIADVTGTSPMRFEVPEDKARAFPNWSALRLEVRLPEGQQAPASVSREQAFDAYASLFYVDPAPPGYSLA